MYWKCFSDPQIMNYCETERENSTDHMQYHKWNFLCSWMAKPVLHRENKPPEGQKTEVMCLAFTYFISKMCNINVIWLHTPNYNNIYTLEKLSSKFLFKWSYW